MLALLRFTLPPDRERHPNEEDLADSAAFDTRRPPHCGSLQSELVGTSYCWHRPIPSSGDPASASGYLLGGPPATHQVALNIPESAVVGRSEDILFSEMSEGTVLMSIERGVYFGLDEVGARVWALLDPPSSVRAIRDQLLEEYEVELEVCSRELDDLLSRLRQQGLVVVTLAPEVA